LREWGIGNGEWFSSIILQLLPKNNYISPQIGGRGDSK